MKKLVVLTGAGISAESGLKTFRDENGLWEGHDIMKVASPEGYAKNPELVLDFYNQRRKQLKHVKPNEAHLTLKKLEKYYDVSIITQNVDNLHEKANSSKVLHLHGELTKVRSTKNNNLIYDWFDDLILGDLCELGSQLRPHIVWFGEAVPMLEVAIEITQKADILVIIGTSMQVYPAASLVHYCKSEIPIYFIDPKPMISESAFENLTILSKTAVEGTKELMKLLSY